MGNCALLCMCNSVHVAPVHQFCVLCVSGKKCWIKTFNSPALNFIRPNYDLILAVLSFLATGHLNSFQC